MATILVIALFLLSIFSLSQCSVEGIKTSYKDEHSDATFTIMTHQGEVYDCVDFYKQPAFSNTLLKNHTLKLNDLARQTAPNGIGLKDGGCPPGTVPILRINKKRENRFHLLSNNHFQGSITPQGDPAEPNHCYAIVRTNDPNSKYLGGAGSVSVYNPPIHGPQWSAARMRLQNGPDSIEAGWMVNQDLFKDTKTHLYIRYIASGKGCFNLQCTGFVQVAKDVPIGMVPDNISERGRQQYGWDLAIVKHKDDGNWWLTIGEDKYGVGYWPKSLFTSLADVANQVEWGGEVYNPPNAGTDVPPSMGCGFRSTYDTKYSSFYAHATLVDEGFHDVEPPNSTVKYQNCKGMYNVLDAGETQKPVWGRLIFFGGPLDQ